MLSGFATILSRRAWVSSVVIFRVTNHRSIRWNSCQSSSGRRQRVLIEHDEMQEIIAVVHSFFQLSWAEDRRIVAGADEWK